MFEAVAGSFRDPSATVIKDGNRIFRSLDSQATQDFVTLQATSLWRELQESGRVVRTERMDQTDIAPSLRTAHGRSAASIIEHDRIAFVSYPYEWPPLLLKRAALHHLDLHIDLLGAGYTIIDGSAYNIQFIGTRPTFIDIPSIRPYQEGHYWSGYTQFCEQFLAPLLCTSKAQIPYHAWYRGSVEGIPLRELWQILPTRQKLDWRMWMHIGVHGRASKEVELRNSNAPLHAERNRPLPKDALLWMLRQLRSWIASLSIEVRSKEQWDRYTCTSSYSEDEASAKRQFVANWTARETPDLMYDVGGNSGEFSEVALQSGATDVICLDADPSVSQMAVHRADDKRLRMLPLVVDMMNPSPAQGWAQHERMGIAERAKCDALLALAVMHHMVLARNAPLREAVKWIVGLAPRGILEFVPKEDVMARRLLRRRGDVFEGYDAAAFRQSLGACANIVEELTVTSSGRTLFSYRR